MSKEWLSESELEKQKEGEGRIKTNIYIKQAGKDWESHTLSLTEEQIKQRRTALDEKVEQGKFDDYCIDPPTPPSN